MSRTFDKRPSGIARYLSRAESVLFALEVAYDGGATSPGSNPANTRVTARGMRKANVQWPMSPWLEAWVRDFGDIKMPEGAWNGIKLAEVIADRAFLGLGRTLSEVAVETGETLWHVETGNTAIYQVIHSLNGGLLIVFNGYYGFTHPQDLANIGAFDFGGREVWRVRRPSREDLFANAPQYENGKLRSASWQGELCTIDDQSGEIVAREFTK